MAKNLNSKALFDVEFHSASGAKETMSILSVSFPRAIDVALDKPAPPTWQSDPRRDLLRVEVCRVDATDPQYEEKLGEARLRI